MDSNRTSPVHPGGRSDSRGTVPCEDRRALFTRAATEARNHEVFVEAKRRMVDVDSLLHICEETWICAADHVSMKQENQSLFEPRRAAVALSRLGAGGIILAYMCPFRYSVRHDCGALLVHAKHIHMCIARSAFWVAHTSTSARVRNDRHPLTIKSCRIHPQRRDYSPPTHCRGRQHSHPYERRPRTTK